jgi:hypothetical protein
VTKAKELEVYQLLRDSGLSFEYQHHLPFRGCGLGSETSCAYADFVLYTAWGAVLLEVDEDQHHAYAPSCDVRRDFDMAASVALGTGGKLAILRYNPDPFEVDGATQRLSKKERHARLLVALGELQAEEPELPFTRLFMFYDKACADASLPLLAQEWDSAVALQVSACL